VRFTLRRLREIQLCCVRRKGNALSIHCSFDVTPSNTHKQTREVTWIRIIIRLMAWVGWWVDVPRSSNESNLETSSTSTITSTSTSTMATTAAAANAADAATPADNTIIVNPAAADPLPLPAVPLVADLVAGLPLVLFGPDPIVVSLVH